MCIKNKRTEETFSTFSEAFANSIEDDTLEIFPGTYNETVVVQKPLKLIGVESDDEMPVLSSSIEDGFSVSIENDVELQNLIIKPQNDNASGIRVYNENRQNLNVKIKNVTVQNASIGIGVLKNAGSLDIEKTTLKDIKRFGIAITESSTVRVYPDCIFDNCLHGNISGDAIIVNNN